MVNMDTDSSYMALTGDLMASVRVDRREAFFERFGDWFVEPFCPKHKADFVDAHLSGESHLWTQQECCKEHELWDSRTPGKFKKEFTGHSILALNAKTYICSKDDRELALEFPYPENPSIDDQKRIDDVRVSHKHKVSSKGLSKHTNNLTDDQFLSVLQSKDSVSGINTGFIRKNNTTFTYSQRRRGLTYFYAKRKVMDDGVSTTHLDI